MTSAIPVLRLLTLLVVKNELGTVDLALFDDLSNQGVFAA
jgi:hypothetical protein